MYIIKIYIYTLFYFYFYKMNNFILNANLSNRIEHSIYNIGGMSNFWNNYISNTLPQFLIW